LIPVSIGIEQKADLAAVVVVVVVVVVEVVDFGRTQT